jgi:deoxycytidine triphosphate deaminase
MSIGFLVDAEQPMVWRGPMVTQALTQLLSETEWGALDYLVVDMPPGTGDIQLTLAQRVPVAGAVIVTTPQDIALADARKGLKMFEKVSVPVLGIVENMSVHVCSQCGHVEHVFGAGGGARMATQYGVRLLGELPLDAHIREETDAGRPTVAAAPDSPRAQAIFRWRAARPPRCRSACATAARCFRKSWLKTAESSEAGHESMSIKSDRWIRRMAREQGMIEPFAPEQVRAVDGHKIVSYGTSSYGYDVRCAPEFKIFTNINSTIVDPKAFDEKSFVDFPGDVCIIPPNSFALARTVEYFRIPRSVLTVCLGKCVTGDTRVVDADTGAYVPITEMRWGKSTLALDRWRLKSAKISAFFPQGKKPVFELTHPCGFADSRHGQSSLPETEGMGSFGSVTRGRSHCRCPRGPAIRQNAAS